MMTSSPDNTSLDDSSPDDSSPDDSSPDDSSLDDSSLDNSSPEVQTTVVPDLLRSSACLLYMKSICCFWSAGDQTLQCIGWFPPQIIIIMTNINTMPWHG